MIKIYLLVIVDFLLFFVVICLWEVGSICFMVEIILCLFFVRNFLVIFISGKVLFLIFFFFRVKK